MDFYGVGYDATETIDELEAYRIRNEFVYQAAVPVGRVITTFNVRSQSSKMAIDGNGIIVYRGGKGAGSDDEWRTVFANLAAGQ